MQSTATTVDAYFKEVPEARKPALERIRAMCKEMLSGFEESMTYGMPCYSRDGVIEVAFNSQKNNIALYILRTDVLNPFRRMFPTSAIGKGCIRYRNAAKIDYGIVEKMLKTTAQTKGPVC